MIYRVALLRLFALSTVLGVAAIILPVMIA
jgi:hypothetical protein